MKVTINDFVRYRKLKQERTRLSRQVIKLEESNGQWVKDKVTGSSPEFPYVSHSVPVIGLLHNTARINAIKDEITEMTKELDELAKCLKSFLDKIPSDKRDIRDVLELYYIDCVGSYEKAVEYAGLEVDASSEMKKVRNYMRNFLKLTVNTVNTEL